MNAGFAYHKVIVNDNNDPIDYKYLEVNPAFEKLTGLKKEDLIGKTVTEAIPGIENIQSTFSGIIKSGISNANLRTIEVWGTEDLITEEGEYSLFVGETEVDQGKYLVLWKKEDGKWKFFRDIFNSNLPAQ